MKMRFAARGKDFPETERAPTLLNVVTSKRVPASYRTSHAVAGGITPLEDGPAVQGRLATERVKRKANAARNGDGVVRLKTTVDGGSCGHVD